MMSYFPKLDKNKNTIEVVSIFHLLDEFNSPLFIISERVIKEKYRLFREVLNKYYSDSQIAYSIKTNYLLEVLKIIKDLGGWAEAVSGFEYWLAKKVGFSSNHIIFNGSDKKFENINNSLAESAILNVDNLSELNNIKKIINESGQSYGIGIRINASIGSQPWDRFGFNLEDGEAYNIAEKIKKEIPRIRLNGLHIHLGTNIKNIDFYRQAAEKTTDFAVKISRDFGFKIDYINLGGGFAIPNYRDTDDNISFSFGIEDYIKNVVEVLNKKFKNKKPKLIFEPGRYLVDESGIFLTTVLNVKNIAGGQLANVDSSVYINLKESNFTRSAIDIIQKKSENDQKIPTWIGGNSCIGADYLARSVYLPKLNSGDILIFYNAGAYTIARGEQWIHPRPAVVMIYENGDVECIRKKENYESLVIVA